jgi:hypothetical protein
MEHPFPILDELKSEGGLLGELINHINIFKQFTSRMMISMNLMDILNLSQLRFLFIETVNVYNDINSYLCEVDNNKMLHEYKNKIYDFLTNIKERLIKKFYIDFNILYRFEILNGYVQRLRYKFTVDKLSGSLYTDFNKFLTDEQNMLMSQLQITKQDLS